MVWILTQEHRQQFGTVEAPTQLWTLEKNRPYASISFTSSLISFTDRAEGPSFYSMYQQREVSPIFPDRHQIHDSTALSNVLKCPELLTRNVTVTAHKERGNILMGGKKSAKCRVEQL